MIKYKTYNEVIFNGEITSGDKIKIYEDYLLSILEEQKNIIYYR